MYADILDTLEHTREAVEAVSEYDNLGAADVAAFEEEAAGRLNLFGQDHQEARDFFALYQYRQLMSVLLTTVENLQEAVKTLAQPTDDDSVLVTE